MPRYVCATCAAQFPDADAPPERCPICERRAPVRPRGRPALDHLRRARADPSQRAARGLRADRRRHGAVAGDRPARAARPARRALRDVGLHHLLRRRGGRRDRAPRRPRGDRDLAPALLLGDGRLGGALATARCCCTPTTSSGSRAPTRAIELWTGETRELGDGLTLLRCGGHFAGGTVLHWRDGAGGAGALLSGDIVQVIPDHTHVGFMYSYPNLIPLPEASVAAHRRRARALRVRGHLRRVVGAPRAPRREGHRAALGGALRARAAGRIGALEPSRPHLSLSGV